MTFGIVSGDELVKAGRGLKEEAEEGELEQKVLLCSKQLEATLETPAGPTFSSYKNT